jgi:hypothetical protein
MPSCLPCYYLVVRLQPCRLPRQRGRRQAIAKGLRAALRCNRAPLFIWQPMVSFLRHRFHDARTELAKRRYLTTRELRDCFTRLRLHHCFDGDNLPMSSMNGLDGDLQSDDCTALMTRRRRDDFRQSALTRLHKPSKAGAMRVAQMRRNDNFDGLTNSSNSE